MAQHVDYGRIYVPFTFPGEQVEAELLHEIRSGQWSARRISPVPGYCAVAGRCGGCLWPGAEYAAQLAAKEKMLRRALAPLPQLANIAVRVHGNASVSEVRNRVHLHARFFQGELALGFYERGSQRLVVIDDCPMAVPALRQLIHQLSKVPKQFVTEDFGFGIELVAYGEKSEDAQIILYGSPKRHAALRDFALKLTPQLKYEVIVHRPDSPPKFRLWHRAHGMSFYTAPGCFQQGNTAQSDLIRDIILRQVAGARVVFDLFCGSGNYSLPIAAFGTQVFGCDENRIAISVAQENIRMNSVTGASYLEGDAAAILSERSRYGWPNSADLVILDPARWGVGKVIPGLLPHTAPRTVVLISNHLQALATDARALFKNGFSPFEMHLVDFFPNTPHMDVVSLWRS